MGRLPARLDVCNPLRIIGDWSEALCLLLLQNIRSVVWWPNQNRQYLAQVQQFMHPELGEQCGRWPGELSCDVYLSLLYNSAPYPPRVTRRSMEAYSRTRWTMPP